MLSTTPTFLDTIPCLRNRIPLVDVFILVSASFFNTDSKNMPWTSKDDTKTDQRSPADACGLIYVYSALTFKDMLQINCTFWLFASSECNNES